MITAPIPVRACANCGTALIGRYCSACGQKATSLNPSAREFAHDLVHEFAHVDGKIVRSTLLLLTRPGWLSREYFMGRRVQYISPIRLYLVFSVLYFALMAIAPAFALSVTCTSCGPELRAIAEESVRDAITHWIPRTMFVLVPLFAALVALAARRARRNYPLHLYFALHVHAAWFAALSVVLLAAWPGNQVVGALAAGLGLIYGVAYPVAAFRRAYAMPLRSASWRMAAALCGYAVAVVAVVIAVMIGVVLPLVRPAAPAP